MDDSFVGEIATFAFGFTPQGWVPCSGQLLPIQQYQALFSLIGTTFGGNGIQNFAVPDLRGRLVVGQGQGPGLLPRQLGQSFGAETHILQAAETPTHVHSLGAVSNPDAATNTSTPDPTVALAQTAGKDGTGAAFAFNLYANDSAPTQTMAPTAIGSTGGQAHANVMPFVVCNVCIAVTGIFPSRG